MNQFTLNILGGSVAEPVSCITSEELDERLGLKRGTVLKKSGLPQRYWLSGDETADDLIIQAVSKALQSAKLNIQDIDCVIDASATMRQALPFNAANICRLMGMNGVSAFDVNMTCLSALRAIDLSTYLLQSYQNILIVSCDIASIDLNKNDLHSFGLFGDGAAALIVSKSVTGKILSSHFAVFPEGYDFCEIQGGGYKNPPVHFLNQNIADYYQKSLFKMDGKKLYRLSSEIIPNFLDNLLAKAQIKMKDIDYVVPHQASRGALNHMVSKLNIPKEKIIDIFDNFGNQIAVSIPHALIYLLQQKNIQGGEKVLIIGTSAGIGVGGIIWQIPQDFIPFQAA